MNGNPEPIFWEPKHPRQKIPPHFDGTLFEIVAKGEVAQHLEKGVVTCRVPHILEVIVFATGPHALLRRCCPDIRSLFLLEEGSFELHHTGVCKEKRRIVIGNQR